jgi:hypothetical protein
MKAFFLALTGLLLLPAVAAALQCGPTEAVLTGLAERYEEKATARGLMPDGSIAMVTATDDGGTWTLLLVKPDGQSCIMAAGRDWETYPAAPAGVEG